MNSRKNGDSRSNKIISKKHRKTRRMRRKEERKEAEKI